MSLEDNLSSTHQTIGPVAWKTANTFCGVYCWACFLPRTCSCGVVVSSLWAFDGRRFRGPKVLSRGNSSRSTNLSVVAELNCSCSANSQSTIGIRYNPDIVGPSPYINFLAYDRHFNLFIFKLASMSASYCRQPLGSGRFQSSKLFG